VPALALLTEYETCPVLSVVPLAVETGLPLRLIAT
jgi:hypothetical protein